MRIFRVFLLALILCGFLITGCAPAKKTEIVQFNTIDSLLSGLYDGAMPLKELRAFGDMGIGTFDRLDGEMLLLKGTFYQITGDGKVHIPPDSMTTPFASVVPFVPQKRLSLSQLSYAAFCEALDAAAPNRNVPVAIMVTADFASMRTRSVPPQSKPYKPLVEVTKNQPEFPMSNVRGTLVGFRLPAYVKGINVPGYHLHFLSDDGQRGGHVLDFRMNSGNVELAEVYRFLVMLSQKDDFARADLSKDRGRELHDVESAKGAP